MLWRNLLVPQFLIEINTRNSMKKILLFMFAAATLAASASAAGQVKFVNLGKKIQSAQTKKIHTQAKARIDQATNTVWKPGTTTSYWWSENYDENGNLTGESWQLNGTSKYTYLKNGNLESITSGDYYTLYEYDTEDRLVKVTSYINMDGKKTPEFTEEYLYDTVVKNLVVKTTSEYYSMGERVSTSVSGDLITRNDAGNIVSIEEYNIDTEGNRTVDARMEYTYGADGKVNTIKAYMSDNGQLQLDSEMIDIEWYQTNGQLVEIDMDEYEFFLGPNRLKSAKGPKATNYPYVADIFLTVEYKADDKGFKMTAKINGEDYMVQDFAYTDEYGSYTDSDYSIDYDHVEGDIYERDSADLTVYTKKFDAYGLTLLDEEKSYTDGDINKGISYQRANKGIVTYDSQYGYPTEYITQNSYDGEEFKNSSRDLYSDYQQFESGVETIIDNNSNAAVEYYNLQGIRVNNPSEGIYIRRQGDKVSKVIIR